MPANADRQPVPEPILLMAYAIICGERPPAAAYLAIFREADNFADHQEHGWGSGAAQEAARNVLLKAVTNGVWRVTT